MYIKEKLAAIERLLETPSADVARALVLEHKALLESFKCDFDGEEEHSIRLTVNGLQPSITVAEASIHDSKLVISS